MFYGCLYYYVTILLSFNWLILRQFFYRLHVLRYILFYLITCLLVICYGTRLFLVFLHQTVKRIFCMTQQYRGTVIDLIHAHYLLVSKQGGVALCCLLFLCYVVTHFIIVERLTTFTRKHRTTEHWYLRTRPVKRHFTHFYYNKSTWLGFKMCFIVSNVNILNLKFS